MSMTVTSVPDFANFATTQKQKLQCGRRRGSAKGWENLAIRRGECVEPSFQDAVRCMITPLGGSAEETAAGVCSTNRRHQRASH